MYSLADLRAGLAIVVEGEPFLILSAQFGRKSQGKPNCATKIKNLKTGAVVQKTFGSGDKLEHADIGFHHVQYLYGTGTSFTFMDLNSYDQFELGEDIVGENASYLKDGLELDVQMYEERPIAVKLPVTVDLEVKETMPGVKGDTATGGSKPATLETGLVVNVPLFVNAGELVRINTERGEYVERVAS